MKERSRRKKDYVRKNGTMVKGTTYYIKDRGKAGKTPVSEKWYQHDMEMHWHKDLPVEVRRKNAGEAHKGDNLATARASQALAYVTTDAETAKLVKADADYFFSVHQAEV